MIQFTYYLEGNIVPKSRPRVTNGWAYLPARYQLWKEDAIIKLIVQKNRYRQRIEPPVSIKIEYSGSKRGDSDNLAGAILDVLVASEIIADDRLNIVPELHFTWKGEKPAGALITITQLRVN